MTLQCKIVLAIFSTSILFSVKVWADEPVPASSLVQPDTQQKNIDPYETYNRHAFAMNETVDKVVFRPVATAYKTVTPDLAQEGIRNVYNNLATVPVIANDLLQLKIYQGTQDLWRLFFNTTFGVLGLFDVASKIGLPPHQNDFGMTLANYGYRNSNYFVIPFLGPSTVRDTAGFGIDTLYLSVYPYIDNVRLRNSMVVLNFIQTRAQYLDYQRFMDQAAVDPYVFQRNAYLQRRAYMLSQNSGQSVESEDPYVAAN